MGLKHNTKHSIHSTQIRTTEPFIDPKHHDHAIPQVSWRHPCDTPCPSNGTTSRWGSRRTSGTQRGSRRRGSKNQDNPRLEEKRLLVPLERFLGILGAMLRFPCG